MPDISYSPLWRLVLALKDVRDRLKRTVPVTNAQCIDFDESQNAYLISLEVFPSWRQCVFTRVTADDCLLMKVDESYAVDGGSGESFVWPRVERKPDLTKGVFRALEFESFVLPAKDSAPKAIEKLFYVIPQKPLKTVNINLKSPQWLMSTSCKVVLDEDE